MENRQEEENIIISLFYIQDEANRADDHSYRHQRQASEGIPALSSDVKKKTTMLVNWGGGAGGESFRSLPGGPGSKIRGAPGSGEP